MHACMHACMPACTKRQGRCRSCSQALSSLVKDKHDATVVANTWKSSPNETCCAPLKTPYYRKLGFALPGSVHHGAKDGCGRSLQRLMRPPVNTPTPNTTQNKTMSRPMSLMHRSLHYTCLVHWSQNGLVWRCGGSELK